MTRDPAMELRNIRFYASEAHHTGDTDHAIHLLATAVEHLAIYLQRNASEEEL
jgi:hypothetical protein